MIAFGKQIGLVVLVTLCFLSTEAKSQVLPMYSGAQMCPSCMGSSAFSHAGACGRACRQGYTQQIRQLRQARRACPRCQRQRHNGARGCGRSRLFSPCRIGCQCAPHQQYCPPAGLALPPATSVPTTSVPATSFPLPVTSYQNYTQTMVRKEAYMARVPVTGYQNQIRYRNVPYQVTTRIPQTRLQYAPAGCSDCQKNAMYGYTPVRPYSSGLSTLPTAKAMVPQQQGLPRLSAPEPISAMMQQYNPSQMQMVPVQNSNVAAQAQQVGQTWQTIKSRHAQKMPAYNYNGDIPRTAMGVKKFSGVPSAARVMQTQLR